MEKMKLKFNWRGWTPFVAAISFMVDLLSGVILYISPPGRVAHWTVEIVQNRKLLVELIIGDIPFPIQDLP